MENIEILSIEEAFKALNESYFDYVVKHENDHYNIYKDDKFICSATTREEAEREIKDMVDDEPELYEYDVSWHILNKDDTYHTYHKNVLAKNELEAKKAIKDPDARDIKAIRI